jgi:exopolyphosphatase / guanosine-5'-triphosphate,3'-diphosphate pyrophosphatase
LTFLLRKLDGSDAGNHAEQQTSVEGRFGIIDIGSNSVRLVIYEAAKRNPVPIFNEKVMAGLGARLSETGKLDPDGVERALQALNRFSALLDQLDVHHVAMVATAAVRDATDGPEFKAQVETTTGLSMRLLSGEEEAKYAALGVLSGIPEADGIVGDLGGGSLELVDIKKGEMGLGETLPLGPLRLVGAGLSQKELLREVDKALEKVDWLGNGEGRTLYAVGGVWRNLARIHMAQNDYPVRVLHDYEIPAPEAADLAKLIERLGPKSLSKIPDVSSRRVGALPVGALVLSRLIAATKVKKVAISAYGLREGVLFDHLSDQDKARDPLLEGANDLARRLVRFPEHRRELVDWTAPLFSHGGLTETESQKRLRLAACSLADIGWYVHPDYRATHALEQTLLAPLSGVSHAERVFLARVAFHRHEGAGEPVAVGGTTRLLSEEEHHRACVMGLGFRIAFTLCAASVGVLPYTRLVLTKETLTLNVQRSHQAFCGEVVEKRLGALGRALNLEPRTQIV